MRTAIGSMPSPRRGPRREDFPSRWKQSDFDAWMGAAKDGYSEDQPRDSDGKWSSEGGSSEDDATKPTHDNSAHQSWLHHAQDVLSGVHDALSEPAELLGHAKDAIEEAVGTVAAAIKGAASPSDAVQGVAAARTATADASTSAKAFGRTAASADSDFAAVNAEADAAGASLDEALDEGPEALLELLSARGARIVAPVMPAATPEERGEWAADIALERLRART